MRLCKLIRCCISALFLSLSTLTLAADPMLNGIAVHTDLGKEQFIGALYSNPLSDNADTLLATAQTMKLELKILAPEGMSTRRFSRLWIEGMAINNTPSLLTEQAENMVKFDGMFKSKLMQNDVVVFNFETGKGTTVVVNDIALGTIAGNNFFGMLLRTWIGKVPLSSEYKEGILKLGNVSADLKSRFEKIKPSKERSLEVASWSKTKTPAELAAEKEAATKSSAQSSSVDSAKQKAELAKAEAAKQAEAAKNAKPVEPAKAVEAAKPVAQTATAADAADDDDKPALTAQSLLARQFYVSDVLKKIRINTRYPAKALQRNQSGSVRVALTLDRMGNVINASLAQASEFDTLNDAAMDAISKSAPFPAMPDSIAGKSFELSAPFTFQLPK